MSPKASRALFYAAAAACVGQALYQYGRLPPLVASHFAASGRPNAYMPRAGFLAFDIGIVVFMCLALTLSIRSARNRSPELLNLPHKVYWLAPERREETLSSLESRLLLFGAATFVLLLEVFHQVFEFNMGVTKTLDHPLTSLGVYTAFVVVWVAFFVRRFNRVPAGA